MNILFVSSECSPFIKTGGLADVIGSLPKYLDLNCSVIIPYYKKIKDNSNFNFIGSTYFNFENKEVYLGLYNTKIDNVNYYFVDNNDYFYNDHIYGFDDAIRFSYFNLAVIESLKFLGIIDILHLNDWHSGLIPFFLKYKYFLNIKTIFTIHNIQYQGIFDKGLSNTFNLYNDTIEFNGKINFMKSAIINADIITTVSDSYRNETLSAEHAYGLEKILQNRQQDYYGIVNGIDNSLFNPKTDRFIYKKFDINTIKSKKINKDLFCKEFGLNNNMLVSLISRLCDQKGINLILESLETIISTTSINFFLMGTGDNIYEKKIISLSETHPSRVKCYIGYNEELAQKVYASSDLLLVPSLFEPCGLSQLIAMRYATLPLVRETGGLKDTVIPFNKFDNSGTGFSFKNFNIDDFKEVLYIAYDTYNSKSWNVLVNNAINEDFSFYYSSKKYLEIYKGEKSWKH